ncbi:MAG: biotin/lipoyl-containing protein [Silvanigrellaceae bacterium]
MKFKVHQKGDAVSWYFEVADHVLEQELQPGRALRATKLDENLKPLGDVQIRLHGDRRSICVDNLVIPFSGAGLLLKGSDARIKMGAPATFRRISIEQIKPIAIKRSSSNLGGGDQKSPLTGKVLSILVKDGQLVNEGDVLLTIEAMKMENRIQAECPGVIQNIKVQSGASVSVGDTLCTLIPTADENGK